MTPLKFAFGIFLGVVVIPWIIRVIQFLDLGETVINHSPGPCELVKGAETGSEDMQVIPGTDIAVISTVKTWMYDNRLKLNTDKIYLFVVNHEQDRDVIEKFAVDIKKFQLTYIESIADPEGFRHINDITAVGERSFYYTNFKYFIPGFMGYVEAVTQLKLGSLAYFDGEKTHILESGLLFPNGVNQSPNGKYLYFANFGEENIRTYEILSNKSLKLVMETKHDTIVDNISIDEKTGDLWLGCQPVAWKIVHHLGNQGSTTSPSQVLKIKTESGIPTDDITEVYVDDGDVITASTVALYHKNISTK